MLHASLFNSVLFLHLIGTVLVKGVRCKLRMPCSVPLAGPFVNAQQFKWWPIFHWNKTVLMSVLAVSHCLVPVKELNRFQCSERLISRRAVALSEPPVGGEW